MAWKEFWTAFVVVMLFMTAFRPWWKLGDFLDALAEKVKAETEALKEALKKDRP